MMKRSLELAAQTGVNLRGVLAWAFTFPETPYFAGYRVLATNGIHLPVLNAFKLLGRLSGERIPVASSGARPLEELLATGVRQEPDVDALATRDGDRIEVVVWHYHDDLLVADPAPIALNVEVPAGFGGAVAVTHTRVDDTHGNAHALWLSQGSPATPSEVELAALREAMEPVFLERDVTMDVAAGSVRLSFELPRFGISLVTIVPAQPVAHEAPAAGEPGCSCGLPASAPRLGLPAMLAFALAPAFWRRRRRAPTSGERSGSSACRAGPRCRASC
jgi:xylan 1,4-beta-xylosidase